MSKAQEITIRQDAENGFVLTIRCQEYMISAEDDLSAEDIAMWQRVADVINRNAAFILGDDHEEGTEPRDEVPEGDAG